MNARIAMLLICSAASIAPCACLVKVPREPFITSSLDRNRGKPHRLALADQEIDRLVDRVITLAKQRELTLVKQTDCTARRCELALRSKPVDRRVFKSTKSFILSYYSRYFVSMSRQKDRVRITAVGVPVLGGEMSCPDFLKRKTSCKVAELNRGQDTDLVTSVRREWGYDISGAVEAETLQGLLVELKRARAVASSRGSSRKPLIVAVFDIEDRSGRFKAATLGQLTEYLSAKVTQIAGYQVIPRDQLRARLATEKRKSFKECFDQRCQIELGKAVAAQKSLATKLLRVGSKCALTSLLYDLKTEATDRAASVKTTCTEEALLTGVEQLARQLSGRDAG